MERTRLANERPYLAWWRTGIAGLAAGFAIGRVVPEVVEGRSWPYAGVGAALTAAGLLHSSTASFGTGRSTRRCARAASLGRDGALLLLAAIGVAAGVASIVLVLFAP